MKRDVNTDDWVIGWKSSYQSDLMTRFRSFFFDRAFWHYGQANDPEARILDIGCGTGFFMSRLLAKGYQRIEGVEPDARLIAPALAERVRISVATALPFEDRRFDVVYFFNVLHHLTRVDDFRIALNEADRCLKPGGTLIMLEPNWRQFYQIEAFVSRILSPVWGFASGIHDALMAEWDCLMHFFEHRDVLAAHMSALGYRLDPERRLLHQWVLVGHKPGSGKPDL